MPAYFHPQDQSENQSTGIVTFRATIYVPFKTGFQLKNLTTGVHAGWINLPYSRDRRAEGLPYFTDVPSAEVDQWVRIVLTADAEESQAWWCIGRLTEWAEGEIAFERVRYENGNCPAALKNAVFSGKARHVIDGTTESWEISELTQQ